MAGLAGFEGMTASLEELRVLSSLEPTGSVAVAVVWYLPLSLLLDLIVARRSSER